LYAIHNPINIGFFGVGILAKSYVDIENRWYPQYPMIAVHPIVYKDERILLAKRAKEPSKGKWAVPGGRVELGETVYNAGKREVLEECSVEIEIERIFDITDSIIPDTEGRISYHFVVIYLFARYKSGNIQAQSDAEDVGWFTLDEAAELDLAPKMQLLLKQIK